jgi:universal stress protein A
MTLYNRILVALDLAAETDELMARARSVAAPNAEIAIVHVLEPAYFYYGMEPGIGMLPDNFEADLLRRAERELATTADRYGVPERLRFLERGHAATQILRLAADRSTDLIVVGSHGRHGWRLLLGSTANGVLHGAPCDVLAVRVKKT